MSHITIMNKAKTSCRVNMTQDGSLSGIIPLTAGGSVDVPTTASYTVYASTTLEDGNTYVTRAHTFTSDSPRDFRAEIKQEGTDFVFHLLALPQETPGRVTMHNTGPSAVVFNVARNGTPLKATSVANALMSNFVSLKERYTFNAIVDGVTTADLSTTDREADISVLPNEERVANYRTYRVDIDS